MALGKRRVVAWGPALIVFLAGLSAWFAAVAGKDALATPLLSGFVLVTLIVSAPSWLKAQSSVGYVIAAAIKLGVFFALAPKGMATLTLGYAQVRGAYGVWQDYLVYFWALPPALFAVTLGEGWVISLRLAERPFAGTWLARRWRLVVPVVAVAAVAGAAWFAFRTQYYMWRMRSGYPPAVYRLVRVGPRALPDIERELVGLGTRRAGDYRSGLAGALVEIRQDIVARRIGSGESSKVEVQLVDVDPAMLRALRSALLDEPDPDERVHIALWSEQLDFNMWLALWHATMPGLPPDGQRQMLSGLAERVRWATHRAAGGAGPWQGVPAAEVRARQREMQVRLGRVTPLLIELLEQRAPGFRNGTLRFWSSQALDVLEALGPLPRAQLDRLAALLPRLQSSYFLRALLDHFGSRLSSGDHRAFGKLLVEAYQKFTERDARTALAFWVRTDGRAQGVPPADFFCSVFDSADARDRLALRAVLQERDRSVPCVVERLGK